MGPIGWGLLALLNPLMTALWPKVPHTTFLAALLHSKVRSAPHLGSSHWSSQIS